MAGNKNLNSAKSARKDEFYTQLTDIEKELRHYRRHFRGKTVLCNCDDPFESNFFKYFVLNFNRLGLKKLISTCYSNSPIAGTQFSLFDPPAPEHEGSEYPYKAVVTTVRDTTGDGGVDLLDVAALFRSGENELTELEGDGDFRSAECLALMDEADIVVTNPPFSLFREYVATLMERGKKFVIIGSMNAITYKEFFPLIMDNKIWIGPSIHSGDRVFYVPDDYPLSAAGCGIDQDGRKYIRVKGVRWFTNLDIKKRHEELILVKRYSPETYPHYDNYDAIEVSKTADIPCDYTGVMGAPITFLDKFNPDQFEIIGFAGGWNGKSELVTRRYPVKQLQHNKNGKETPIGKMNDGTAYICSDEKPTAKTYSTIGDGKYYLRVYGRILIRNKHPEAPKED